MVHMISLGFSPCPNDTFIFDALVHRRIPMEGLVVKEVLRDVQELNEMTMAGKLDVSKVSMHALGRVGEQYVLLRSGAALGRGCGPLLVARQGMELDDLHSQQIGLPGEYTTASLLFRMAFPYLWERVVMLPFYEIPPTVADGRLGAGVIIHESRFTFQRLGLVQLADLGQWWERHSGLPLPLGGIVARRTLGEELIDRVERLIRASLEYARRCPSVCWEYVAQNAQEPDENVIREHIDLYVNEFSVVLGPEGEAAVRELMVRGEAVGAFQLKKVPLIFGRSS